MADRQPQRTQLERGAAAGGNHAGAGPGHARARPRARLCPARYGDDTAAGSGVRSTTRGPRCCWSRSCSPRWRRRRRADRVRRLVTPQIAQRLCAAPGPRRWWCRWCSARR
ncbi:hypothetical protein HBB16_21565 [Pseudonocardia sp. MCCB 268]|nr:hypothetical protein [Pseudonocardia cytotoxica]